jgi:hypothetical protein
MSKAAMILKSDAGGRVVVPLARQVELVREFECSGLSGPRFAAMAGVKYQTFATWRREKMPGIMGKDSARTLILKRLEGGRDWLAGAW